MKFNSYERKGRGNVRREQVLRGNGDHVSRGEVCEVFEKE